MDQEARGRTGWESVSFEKQEHHLWLYEAVSGGGTQRLLHGRTVSHGRHSSSWCFRCLGHPVLQQVPGTSHTEKMADELKAT